MDLALVVLFCSTLLTAEPIQPTDIAPDTLVVCDPRLERAIGPWIQYRTAQGHRLSVVSNFDTATDIKDRIRAAAQGGRLKFVVLVGDVGRPGQIMPDEVDVPTRNVPAQINVRWGSEPEIATDNWYADLDDDAVPDVAIGRLSANTPEQLSLIIQKTIDYERSASMGLWRRRVNFVAGVGGFGALADKVIESAARSFISRGIPDTYRTSMTYASWRSPYCPDPRLFRQTVIERMNEGCLFWIYIGHGHRQGLDWIRVPTGAAPILQANDVSRVRATTGLPIAVFLSCYAGAFDGTDDCLAEKLLWQERGPVAILAGSRVTMPYGMAVLSNAMMDYVFRDRQQTLGEVMLLAKRHSMDKTGEGFSRRLLDAMAASISPNPDDLEGERREHLHLFNLLGDPLLRIRHPRELEVKVARSIEPGGRLRVECESELTGDCLVELVCRRGQLTYRPDPRTEFDGTSAGMKLLSQEYQRANDDCYVSRQFRTVRRSFSTLLPVPEHAMGACRVRVFVRDDEDFATGAARVHVTRPKPETSGAD